MPVDNKSWKKLREQSRRSIQGDLLDKNLPRQVRRALAKEMEKDARAHARESADLWRESFRTGVGLLADKQLREFLAEYSNRLSKYGGELPSSFNVMRSFFEYDEKRRIFTVKPEKDHLFSFADFIDFATSPDCNVDSLDYANLLEDETIYSYTNYEPVDETTFSTNQEYDFGFGSVSLVKCGPEVTVFLTAGRVADFDELLQDQAGPDAYQTTPGRENIGPHPKRQRRPEALPGAKNRFLHQTLSAVRFNAETRATDVQYVFVDMGNNYRIVTDDPIPLSPLGEEKRQVTMASLEKQMTPYRALVELCGTSLALPHYFRFKIDLVRDELPKIHIKDPSQSTSEQSSQDLTSNPGAEPAIKVRRITALRIIRPIQHRMVRRYTPPSYQVEVSGFWRSLAPDSVGKDAYGNRVEGRTWVKEHLRWRDKPGKSKEILIKSRVAIARAIAASDRLDMEESSPRSSENQEARTNTPSSTSEEMAANSTVSREAAYKERRKLTSRLRWRIFIRDDFRCVLCGADAAENNSVRLAVDHIVPIVRGGKTEPDNLRTLCSICNNGKGAELP